MTKHRTQDSDSPSQALPIVVGIGASAGGLAALQRFFRVMPADSGLAFVVILHLDPTRESAMAEILGNCTAMPVAQVNQPVAIQANHIYVIPPNSYLETEEGELRLFEPDMPRGQRKPVDALFRSLAKEYGRRAIGIILSGTGSNGSVGLGAIKQQGGVIIVQDPDTADHDGMSKSAIATGQVDLVLPVEEMPQALLDYAYHPYLKSPPQEADSQAPDPHGLEAVLAALRGRRDFDFSCYKRGTLTRRVQRRMGLSHIQSYGAYLAYLQSHPEEAQALARDLMISVTHFFRDPGAWAFLADKVLEPLCRGQDHRQAPQIWVPGCATGEEAYTLAMLLVEQQPSPGRNPPARLFASDLNSDALAFARRGLYSNGSATDVSPERLGRFFSKEEQGYRIGKALRSLVTFAAHNLISDPPFGRLDLISCRNLLIYLEPEIQKKVLSLFHFALKPGGYLMLGTAESMGQQQSMYEELSHKWRIYQRIGHTRLDQVAFPIARSSSVLPSLIPELAVAPSPPRLARIAQQLVLERYTRACVLVHRNQDILYFFGPIHDYLRQPVGEATMNLPAWTREALRPRLRSALQEVLDTGEAARVRGVPWDEDSQRRVDFTVELLRSPQELKDLLLVAFQDHRLAPVSAADLSASGHDSSDGTLISQLQADLQQAREENRSLLEQVDIASEEFKSANEEMISINEELQSANEELETSKEELQSLNEELGTINQQLEAKNQALEATNDDLKNLLTSTEIATLFLDRQFHIRRFTPAMTRLIRLIQGDIGRSIKDITSQFDDAELLTQAAQVLDRLIPVEAEIATTQGEWYLRRITPYRTQDNRIDGVVVTFLDITERRSIEQAMRRSELRLQVQTECLQDQDRLKNEFLAMLGHELRNPIASISNTLEALVERDGLPVETEKAVAMLNRQCQQIQGLVNDLLDVARITRGQITLQRQRVNLAEALEQAVATLRPILENHHGQHLELTLPEQPLWVEGDRNRLIQVFSNLLDNAIRYTDKGGRIAVSLARRGEQAVIQVRDTGRGIPPDRAHAIFELFSTFNEGSGGQSSGLGVGLALAKRLMEMHGGQVMVESPGLGQGSTFTVRLPLVCWKTAPESAPAAPAPQAFIRRRVLVVDDDQAVAEALSLLLMVMGHEVQVVHTGAEALPVVKDFHPELVLLDLSMPGQDGFQVARSLRERHDLEKLKLVALSGYGDEQTQRRAREAGFDGYLLKPTNTAQLKSLLADLGVSTF